jgi:oxygen-independent coproporphyrinogen-3 oxidase
MAMSLYVHIPFCQKRCIYCDFVSGLYTPEKATAYIHTLKKEILNIPDNVSLKTLYIGGGTPSILSHETLCDLIAHIFSHLPFVPDYEATIEVNPGTLDEEKARSVRSCGINRVSIGIQSFHDDELSLLGRVHTRKEAERSVHIAREAGFENIGIDLMYGIPGQKMKGWKESLEKTVNLKPKHISIYELTVERSTVLGTYVQKGTLTLPEEERIVEMYDYAIDYLKSSGYIHYEISNFAMPDYPCRHNLNYWERGEYYGAGLGAHSFLRGRRFHNTGILDQYIHLMSENKGPVQETETITAGKALSEALFLGLRKIKGINLKTFSERYEIDVLKHFENEMKDLQSAGLIEIHGTTGHNQSETHLKLTRNGLLLSNEVFVKFF